MNKYVELCIALKVKLDKAEHALDRIARLDAGSELPGIPIERKEIKIIIDNYYKEIKND